MTTRRSRIVNRRLALGSALAVLLLAPWPARADSSIKGVVAVCTSTSPGYSRKRLPDGSLQPEEYGFYNGGRMDGSAHDPAMEKMRFEDFARALVEPLAQRRYVPAKSRDSARIMIVVYWGLTATPASLDASLSSTAGTHTAAASSVGAVSSSSSHADLDISNSGMARLNDMERSLQDYKNAKLLGYERTILASPTETGLYMVPVRRDLLEEVEDSRYFVVLLAYDYQALRKGTKVKLWEARFSISETRNYFDKALPIMARMASAYFGEDSGGLQRNVAPEGRVEIGEPKTIGDSEQPAR